MGVSTVSGTHISGPYEGLEIKLGMVVCSNVVGLIYPHPN